MKLKFIIFTLFCISLFSSESIRITNGEWDPYMSEKAHDFGFISKSVSDVFISENIKVTYGFFPWVRALELAKSNQWDGSIGWAKSKEREEEFIFSKEPLFTGNVVLFYFRSNYILWDKIEDLKKYKIGITNGYSYGNKFDDFIKDNPQNIEIAVSDLNNFKKLFSGRIDAFVMDLDIGLKILKDNFLENELREIQYSTKSLDERPQYLILNKNSKNKVFMEKFDNAFKKLQTKKLIDKNIDEFRKSIIKIKN